MTQFEFKDHRKLVRQQNKPPETIPLENERPSLKNTKFPTKN